MSGEGGTVDDRTLTEIAGSMRRMLGAIEAGELTCSAAQRHRFQGVVVALEALASGLANDRMGDGVQGSGSGEHDQA